MGFDYETISLRGFDRLVIEIKDNLSSDRFFIFYLPFCRGTVNTLLIAFEIPMQYICKVSGIIAWIAQPNGDTHTGRHYCGDGNVIWTTKV